VFVLSTICGAKCGITVKIGIVACGAIVREMIAVARRSGWDFELTAIPAQYHMNPERIAPAVEQQFDEWGDRFDLVLVGYADCGTVGSLDALLERYPHARRIPGPHCYEFYGGPAFAEHSEAFPGTFYLTDFLARHFDGLVWNGLGLDRHPELRDSYFANYSHVLYMRQQAEHDQSERARTAALRLGLQYSEVDTGLDVLAERMQEIVDQRRLEFLPSVQSLSV